MVMELRGRRLSGFAERGRTFAAELGRLLAPEVGRPPFAAAVAAAAAAAARFR